jgi:ferric-dicitrate binding protein FerR (iron transport regulator)
LQRITRQPAVTDQPSADALHLSSVDTYPSSFDAHPSSGALRRFPGRWWMAAAAVLVLGVMAGGLLYRGQRRPEVAAVAPVKPGHDKEITTRYGTRNFLELPDGSKLWLNAGSRVKYAESFAGGQRELTLEGEAFFDVKHDPDHPFIIHTGKLDVRVLGTSFNVKAYPDDSTIETTLIKGKVEIDFPGNTRSGIVLRPNEKVVIPKKEATVAQTADAHVDRKMVAPDPVYRTLIETSWVEDKLAFRNESFSDVSKRLERWYNIHFSFENNLYLQGRLTGCFKDQPIKNVMDALQISFGFRYRIDGDTIRIW